MKGSDSKGLVMCLNIQSVLPHMDELRMNIKTINPDIICLSETRTTEEIEDFEIRITDYNLIRVDSKNRHTGGVIIYI